MNRIGSLVLTSIARYIEDRISCVGTFRPMHSHAGDSITMQAYLAIFWTDWIPACAGMTAGFACFNNARLPGADRVARRYTR